MFTVLLVTVLSLLLLTALWFVRQRTDSKEQCLKKICTLTYDWETKSTSVFDLRLTHFKKLIKGDWIVLEYTKSPDGGRMGSVTLYFVDHSQMTVTVDDIMALKPAENSYLSLIELEWDLTRVTGTIWNAQGNEPQMAFIDINKPDIGLFFAAPIKVWF